MTKRRRNGHPCSRSFSESDGHTRLNEAKRPKQQSSFPMSFLCGGSAASISHFQALQRCSSSVALADVFEWLGDAVIGELVGRCLLSQFYTAPLSARVFRNLRLAVVTNRNLAQVYDAMGYAAVQRQRHKTGNRKSINMKQRADVVEAVVGELVLTLHQGEGELDKYRAHLDTIVATMLHCHFAELSLEAKEKGETRLSAKGPLSLALNLFACLPNERLDEGTGELIVVDGVDLVGDIPDKRFYRNEYVVLEVDTTKPFHCFATSGLHPTIRCESVRFAMMQLDANHVLPMSREIFEVFKIYGMAVLLERISLLLAIRHVSPQQSKRSELVTSAMLTKQRQQILSVSNLAECAISLGVAEHGVQANLRADSQEEVEQRLQKEYQLANTLRAFVGFHSAIAMRSTSASKHSNVLITTICSALCGGSTLSEGELQMVEMPEREPLVAMKRSVGEARMFMNSKACDALHACVERPVSKVEAKRKRKLQPCLMLRQCDSNTLENLCETLNNEQQGKQKQGNVCADLCKRQVKKRKPSQGFAATAGCITRNLARFLHRRFLFCLEEIVILFAQHQTKACRAQMIVFKHDLVPCVEELHFRKWEVSASTLTLAMRDSFFRMLLHDVCQFHAILSSSRNTQDGTRITQLRLPLHYTWSNINTRITTEQLARS